MRDGWLSALKRKTIVAGHYGSGKTEFSVSLAMLLTDKPGLPVALIDLGIVNPYFRSRERRELLENAGVAVYGSIYNKEITAELPALGSAMRAPLEDGGTRVIIDLGGNAAGASIINPFLKYFSSHDTTVAAAVNINRPGTCDAGGALGHISEIEEATGLSVTHIINNSHMLRETTADDIIRGHELCREICMISGRKLLCDCYPAGLIDPALLAEISGSLMPLGLYMRPAWLDK